MHVLQYLVSWSQCQWWSLGKWKWMEMVLMLKHAHDEKQRNQLQASALSKWRWVLAPGRVHRVCKERWQRKQWQAPVGTADDCMVKVTGKIFGKSVNLAEQEVVEQHVNQTWRWNKGKVRYKLSEFERDCCYQVVAMFVSCRDGMTGWHCFRMASDTRWQSHW